MPQAPTAIRLTWRNADVISDTLNIPIDKVREDLEDPTPVYYVRDLFADGIFWRYVIYNEHDFLAAFAKVPTRIEDRFVPVLQVKADS